MPSENVLDQFKPVSSCVKRVVESKGAILDIEIVFIILILPVPKCCYYSLGGDADSAIVLRMVILFLCQLLFSITSSSTSLHLVLLPQ